MNKSKQYYNTQLFKLILPLMGYTMNLPPVYSSTIEYKKGERRVFLSIAHYFRWGND